MFEAFELNFMEHLRTGTNILTTWSFSSVLGFLLGLSCAEQVIVFSYFSEH